MIDTLAAAYAETGDFNLAVQYAAQALGVKDISPADAKRIQRHLESFQQREPIRLQSEAGGHCIARRDCAGHTACMHVSASHRFVAICSY